MEKLDPKAVWIFFFKFLGIIGLVLALILVYFFWMSADWTIIIFPLVIIWLFASYGWAELTYHFYRYELTEDGFRKEKGVIWKKYVTIPYERIQNVDIYRGVLARIFGLSDLSIFKQQV